MSSDFMDRFEIDTEPIPDDEKYGGGLDHDYEAARQTDASADTQPDNDDESTDTDTDTQPEVPPETPAWIDDSRGLIREDLTQCVEYVHPVIEDLARAKYQAVRLPHQSAWFQLLDRHGLFCIGGEHIRLEIEKQIGASGAQHWYWTNTTGLYLDVSRRYRADREDSSLAYLAISGPEQPLIAFIEDLLTLAQWIKRELCAPAPVAVAGHTGMYAVDDSDRLIDRERSANVVRRLPAPGGEQ